MVTYLESSGYKADSSLGSTDMKELAKGLRADDLLGGVDSACTGGLFDDGTCTRLREAASLGSVTVTIGAALVDKAGPDPLKWSAT